MARKHIERVIQFCTLLFDIDREVRNDSGKHTNENTLRDGNKSSCRCDRNKTNHRANTKAHDRRFFARQPMGCQLKWANGAYTNMLNNTINNMNEVKRMRSATAPTTSAGVIIANINWNNENKVNGIVNGADAPCKIG